MKTQLWQVGVTPSQECDLPWQRGITVFSLRLVLTLAGGEAASEGTPPQD